jgi:SAM-dependent methyltransferase
VVSFEVSADAYMRFMGRYSEPLAAKFADLAGVRPGQRVLDVGCGPGALTAELVGRAGADAVSAVEPSASFAAAARDRLPGIDIRQSAAEQLPFPGDAFDATLAQLPGPGKAGGAARAVPAAAACGTHRGQRHRVGRDRPGLRGPRRRPRRPMVPAGGDLRPWPPDGSRTRVSRT